MYLYTKYPNYVVLGVSFNFLEPVSLHIKCEDDVLLSYRGVLRLNKRVLFYHLKISECKIIYWNKLFQKKKSRFNFGDRNSPTLS